MLTIGCVVGAGAGRVSWPPGRCGLWALIVCVVARISLRFCLAWATACCWAACCSCRWAAVSLEFSAWTCLFCVSTLVVCVCEFRLWPRLAVLCCCWAVCLMGAFCTGAGVPTCSSCTACEFTTHEADIREATSTTIRNDDDMVRTYFLAFDRHRIRPAVNHCLRHDSRWFRHLHSHNSGQGPVHSSTGTRLLEDDVFGNQRTHDDAGPTYLLHMCPRDLPMIVTRTLASFVMRRWVPLWWCLGATFAHASVTVQVGDRNLTFYSPPVNRFLGPQPGDPASATVSGRLAFVTGDYCDPGLSARDEFTGKIVVLGANGYGFCLMSHAYLNIVKGGASAVLRIRAHGVPGTQTNLFLNAAHPQGGLFLEVGMAEPVYADLIRSANATATASPDANVWVDVFASWYYQVFVRGIPGAILVVTGVSAVVFLHGHLAIAQAEYEAAVPWGSRGVRRRVGFLLQRVDYPVATLFVESVTATLVGGIVCAGGWYSTSNVAGPVQYFFTTCLTGWGFVCSTMSAITWNRTFLHVSLRSSPSWATRALCGEYPSLVAFLCAVAVVIDTVLSTMLSMGDDNFTFQTVAAGVLLVLQIVTGTHLVVSALRFYYLAARLNNEPERPASSKDIQQRLSRCTLGLGSSMLMVSTAFALMSISHSFLWSPAGWTLSWAMFLTGRALDSAFRVVMFRPVRPCRTHPVVNSSTVMRPPGRRIQ